MKILLTLFLSVFFVTSLFANDESTTSYNDPVTYKVEVLLVKGQGEFVKGDYNKSLKYFDEAYKMMPDNEEVVFNMLKSYYSLNEFVKAGKLIEKTIKVSSHKSLFKLELAKLYLRQKKYDKSLNILKNSNEFSDITGDYYFIRGLIFLKKKEWKESINNFVKGEKSFKDIKLLKYNLAIAYIGDKDFGNAKMVYKELIPLYSDDKDKLDIIKSNISKSEAENKKFYFSTSLQLNYDTNIALDANGELITSDSSGFVSLLNINGYYNLMKSKVNRLKIGANLHKSYVISGRDTVKQLYLFDTSQFKVFTGYTLLKGRYRMELKYSFNDTLLAKSENTADVKTFLRAHYLYLNNSYKILSKTFLLLNFSDNFQNFSYLNSEDSDNDRDGKGGSAELGIRYFFTKSFYLNTSLDYKVYFAEGKNYNQNIFSPSLLISYGISDSLSLLLLVEYEQSNYYDSNYSGNERVDSLVDGMFAVQYDFSKSFSLYSNIYLSKVYSSIDSFSYNKNIFNLGVEYKY